MVDQHANDNSEQSRIELDHEIVFITLTGEELTTTATRIDLSVTEEHSVCTLFLDLNLKTYQQLRTGEWMGLLAGALNSESELAFDPDQPVELRVILKQSMMSTALRLGTEIEQVLQALLASTEEVGRLRCSESWLVIEVKQRMTLPDEFQGGGTLKRGFRTLWAESTSWRVTPPAEQVSLNDVVEQYLDEQVIPYEWMNESILRLTYDGENGSWIVLIRSDEEQNICIVYSIYPSFIPVEQRPGIAVFLMEENYDIPVGSFELDSSDGELRFRTSIDTQNDRLTPELLGQLFLTNVGNMDHYFNVIREQIEVL